MLIVGDSEHKPEDIMADKRDDEKPQNKRTVLISPIIYRAWFLIPDSEYLPATCSRLLAFSFLSLSSLMFFHTVT
jgi:hypothetical protein